MNHSLYSADRQTHRKIIGSAFVMIATITLLGVAASVKRETQPAEPSVAVLRAGIPVAMADGGYFIIH
jgi:tellurite resistance protein